MVNISLSLSLSSSFRVALLTLLTLTATWACKNKKPGQTEAQKEIKDPHYYFETVVDACNKRDADLLWPLMTERFKQVLETRAKELREQGDETFLKEAYGHTGSISEFRSKQFLAGEMNMSEEWGMCHNSRNWRILDEGYAGDMYVIVVKRDEDLFFGLRIKQADGRWLLDDITKSAKK